MDLSLLSFFMKFLKKPLFTGFMPNLEFRDVLRASSFFLPWKWNKIQRGPAVAQVERELEKYFQVKSATTFDSGRSALYFALKALQIQKGDGVLVQAYTCGVVSNAIIWSGGTPQYVDIRPDCTMNPEDLKKKITPQSKVLLIQHTFGIPAQMESLLQIAREHNLMVIEDCAHVIGGKYKGKLLGTFGDMGMLSFGSDKALSCGRGGALITNNPELAENIQELQSELTLPPLIKTLQQLITFKIFYFTKPLYNFEVGKWILAFGKKVHLLSRIIEQQEKQGQNLPFYPSIFPNSLAYILLRQLKRLEFFNAERLKWTEKYKEHFPGLSLPEKEVFLLRFPLFVARPHHVHQAAKKEGILFGDWYNSPIAPKDMRQDKMQYVSGSCPMAEKLASQSINLPIHFRITQKQFERIVKIIRTYAN